MSTWCSIMTSKWSTPVQALGKGSCVTQQLSKSSHCYSISFNTFSTFIGGLYIDVSCQWHWLVCPCHPQYAHTYNIWTSDTVVFLECCGVYNLSSSAKKHVGVSYSHTVHKPHSLTSGQMKHKEWGFPISSENHMKTKGDSLPYVPAC